MAKSFVERFIEWQNYAHYLLLAIWVFIWHFLPPNKIIEQMYIADGIVGILALIGWWFLGLLVGDSLIHAFFWYLPKNKGQWRD